MRSPASIQSSIVQRTPLAVCLALVFAGGAANAEPAPQAPENRSVSPQTAAYKLRQQIRQRPRGAGAAHARRGMAPPMASAPNGGDVLPVTSCADDGSPGTLRSVVAGAGENDTIDLSQLTCSTITLASGPIDSSMLGDNGLYYLTLQGPGEDALTIDGAGVDQVFVGGGFSSAKGRFELHDLTVANGNYPHGLAGCIELFGGTLALVHVTVTGCSASNGGPLTFGGAVDTSYLEMTKSSIIDSSSAATGDNVAVGGGAYVANDAVLTGSTISGNRVTAETAGDGTFYITAGGGMYVRGALTMTRSTISNNNVVDYGNAMVPPIAPGGGIFVRAQTDISDSTFDGNLAPEGGGLFKAVFSNYGDPGTTLNITNSTFSGNGAFYGGGGIVTRRPTVITSTTIANNGGNLRVGGLWCRGDCSLELQSSIVARNGYGDLPGMYWDIDSDTPITIAGANNLVMVAPGITLPPDTLDGDPLLQPLGDNGGKTRTLALGDGSPAIDTGNNAAALEFDQRGGGFPRVVGAAADIGAFEVQEQEPDDIVFKDGFDGTGRVVH